MAKRLQHRGGTTSQHSTFTGAAREVTVDTDKNTLVINDGATAGGHALPTLTGTETLTNKTLTSPKINEDVVVTSTATELNKLDALSRGSILYGNASAVTSILTKGTANQVLTSDGTDISWSAVESGDNTPAFLAKKTTSQTVTHNVYTKIEFDSEDYDTDSAYDNSTNYRFTVPTGKAGKYFIYSRLTLDSNGTGSNYIILTLYKNGSRVFASKINEGGLDLDEPSISLNITLDLAENDYIELYGTMAIGSGNPTIKLTSDSAYLNWFGAYKILT